MTFQEAFGTMANKLLLLLTVSIAVVWGQVSEESARDVATDSETSDAGEPQPDGGVGNARGSGMGQRPGTGQFKQTDQTNMFGQGDQLGGQRPNPNFQSPNSPRNQRFGNRQSQGFGVGDGQNLGQNQFGMGDVTGQNQGQGQFGMRQFGMNQFDTMSQGSMSQVQCPQLYSRTVNITCVSPQGDRIMCSAAMTPGTTVSMQCKKNYVELEELAYKEIRCLGLDGWSRPLMTCISEPIAVGYKYVSGIGFYKLYTEVRSWSEAKKTCEGDGGHLLVVDSAEERDMVLNLLKQSNNNRTAGANARTRGDRQSAFGNRDANSVYIGISDYVVDGVMASITGSNVTIGWCPLRPVNTPRKPDCAVIRRGPQMCCSDVPCASRRSFICEIEIKYVPQLPSPQEQMRRRRLGSRGQGQGGVQGGMDMDARGDSVAMGDASE